MFVELSLCVVVTLEWPTDGVDGKAEDEFEEGEEEEEEEEDAGNDEDDDDIRTTTKRMTYERVL